MELQSTSTYDPADKLWPRVVLRHSRQLIQQVCQQKNAIVAIEGIKLAIQLLTRHLSPSHLAKAANADSESDADDRDQDADYDILNVFILELCATKTLILEQLAERMATRARQAQKAIGLEDCPESDQKIAFTALAISFPALQTYSEQINIESTLTYKYVQTYNALKSISPLKSLFKPAIQPCIQDRRSVCMTLASPDTVQLV